MCHVSDPCASSPKPLDQTIIRWMMEMEWSCASLHAFLSGANRHSYRCTILPEYTCHGHLRGDKKHLVKVGPKASLYGGGRVTEKSIFIV